ncbi:MAG: hypothetical protein AAFQ90_13520, partial [Pseudomonadota bacterium]
APDGRGASGFAPELRSDCPYVRIDPTNEEVLSGPPVLQAAIEKVAARRLRARLPARLRSRLTLLAATWNTKRIVR